MTQLVGKIIIKIHGVADEMIMNNNLFGIDDALVRMA